MTNSDKSIRARLMRISVSKMKRMEEVERDAALVVDVGSKDPFQRAIDALDGLQRASIDLIMLK